MSNRPFLSFSVLLGFIGSSLVPASAARAQDRPTVAILPVSSTLASSGHQYAAKSLEGIMVQTMSKLGRIAVLDRTQASNVSAEREMQKSVDFIDGKMLAAQGQSLGAQMVLTANVDKLTLNVRTIDNKGTESHEGNMTVTVRLIDVATQEVKNSAVLNADANSGGKKGFGAMLSQVMTTHETAEDALTAMTKNLISGLDAFFLEAFPTRYQIAQVENMSADSSQATFLVDGGKNLGAKLKLQLMVFEATQVKVGARTISRQREIGTVEIVKLDGEELSIGQMRTGAREVAQLLKDGKTVYAVPR